MNKLTKRQLDIVRGSLLGDMSITLRKNGAHLIIARSIKDRNYLNWLRREIPQIFVARPYRRELETTTLCCMTSRVHADLIQVYKDLIPKNHINGKYSRGCKVITMKYLKKLTPLSIAV